MTPLIWRRVAILVVVVIGGGLAGTWTAEQMPRGEAAHRDQQEVARMTGSTKTVCIGRFLIDMPREAQIELTGSRVDGLEVQSFQESVADVRLRVALRERRLKADPRQIDGTDYLESVEELGIDNGVAGKIFIHGRTVTDGTRMRGLELERYRDEASRSKPLPMSTGQASKLEQKITIHA